MKLYLGPTVCPNYCKLQRKLIVCSNYCELQRKLIVCPNYCELQRKQTVCPNYCELQRKSTVCPSHSKLHKKLTLCPNYCKLLRKTNSMSQTKYTEPENPQCVPITVNSTGKPSLSPNKCKLCPNHLHRKTNSVPQSM